MTDATDIIAGHIQRMVRRQNGSDGDYDVDGVRYCGVCNEPKQAWIDWGEDSNGEMQRMLVPVMCKCEDEAYKKEETEDERQKFNAKLRERRDYYGLNLNSMAKTTFDKDDKPNSKIARICRRYVDKWEVLKENNIGMLLYGALGTGKSFYAACIANALAEKKVQTLFTNTAAVMAAMQDGHYSKTEIINHINTFELVVLDDVGAERDTSYSAELMYSVIDGRYRSKLPAIITTNLDLDDMQKETELWRKRIYDRIIEMCPTVIRYDGESRRNAIADERLQMARALIFKAEDGGSNNDGA